jgi:hypothetical protein
MTRYINRRVGKLLFPHLARDQRDHQMSVILLVLGTSLFIAGSIAMWMLSGRR